MIDAYGDAVVTSANTLAACLKTITTAHAEYTKKSFQEGADFLKADQAEFDR